MVLVTIFESYITTQRSSVYRIHARVPLPMFISFLTTNLGAEYATDWDEKFHPEKK